MDDGKVNALSPAMIAAVNGVAAGAGAGAAWAPSRREAAMPADRASAERMNVRRFMRGSRPHGLAKGRRAINTRLRPAAARSV